MSIRHTYTITHPYTCITARKHQNDRLPLFQLLAVLKHSKLEFPIVIYSGKKNCYCSQPLQYWK